MATCPSCLQRYDAGMFCPRDGTRLVDDAGPSAVLGGRYRLIRMVGIGGVGEVYEAEHIYLHRKVAVKILRREIAGDPGAVERLQREAQSTSGLGHPNIVDCLDFGVSDNGQVYLVMEWLEGENLDARLQRGPLALDTTIDITAQVAAGLAEAHDRGVVHRDLKPANVFLTRDRRRALVVKVLDFGIAKLVTHETRLTATGVLVGTPNYMAPEQASGDPIDRRTDIYALGVMVYEMLTGSVPFHADSPLGVLHQHTARIPVSPAAQAPERGISPALETVVMRCLAKRADDRFASMHEVIEALDAIRAVVPPLPSGSLVDEEAPAADLRRDRGPARVLAAGVLALGLALVVVFSATRSCASHHRGTSVDAAAPRPTAIVADAGGPTPTDATPIAAAPPDAAPADAAAVVWRHDGRGAGFNYHAMIAAPGPVVGKRFVLQLMLHDPGPALRAASTRDGLRIAISLAYYTRDDIVVYEAEQDLDSTLHVEFPIEVTRAGKYHVHLELLDGKDRLDQARFDVVVKASR